MGKKHSERAHALLSASGAKRWMACTPSAVLEDKMPESTSVFAEEGTLAHEYAEAQLFRYNGDYSAQKFGAAKRRIKKHKLYSTDMEEPVSDYVDFVVVEHKKSGGILLIEQRVDLTSYVPESFGTNDAIIIADGVMKVIDLKFGQGVKVDAWDNPQLMLYALGAYEHYSLSYDIHSVEMVIHQPRLHHISVELMSVEKLLVWGEDEVKPRAQLAFAGKGEFKAGDHCRFCKLAPTCRALRDKNMSVVRDDFAPPPNKLTDEELIEIHFLSSQITTWLGQVNSYLLVRALDGDALEGLKLVAGRSRRVITDMDGAEQALLTAGYEEIYKQDLLPITKLEKVTGKKEFEQIVGMYIEKPLGKPTLAGSDDPRPVYASADAKTDFGG